MSSQTPQPTARIGGHSIHTMLAPIPFNCFLGTLVTDIVYWRTADMQWANFSVWMLTVGLLVSVLVVLFGLIDLALGRRTRAQRATWLHGLGEIVALVLAVFNAFVHSRDAYTSVVPTGLALSVLTVAILFLTGLNDRSMMTYRRAVREDHI